MLSRLPLAGGPPRSPHCGPSRASYDPWRRHARAPGRLLMGFKASYDHLASYQPCQTLAGCSTVLPCGGLRSPPGTASSAVDATTSYRTSRRWARTALPAAAAVCSEGGVVSVAALLPQDAARGEQQALLSLLQEIETYGSSSSTKLSLKVYHLQQLATIRGASYLLLQQHPGIARLMNDLTAAAAAAPAAAAASSGELSPQQLHALVRCCCKLKVPGSHPIWKCAIKQMIRHTNVNPKPLLLM